MLTDFLLLNHINNLNKKLTYESFNMLLDLIYLELCISISEIGLWFWFLNFIVKLWYQSVHNREAWQPIAEEAGN